MLHFGRANYNEARDVWKNCAPRTYQDKFAVAMPPQYDFAKEQAKEMMKSQVLDDGTTLVMPGIDSTVTRAVDAGLFMREGKEDVSKELLCKIYAYGNKNGPFKGKSADQIIAMLYEILEEDHLVPDEIECMIQRETMPLMYMEEEMPSNIQDRVTVELDEKTIFHFYIVCQSPHQSQQGLFCRDIV